jgi:hypothetical protein
MICMKDNPTEGIDESGLSIERIATTPASRTLVEVNTAAPVLPKDRSDSFRSVVVKLLFVAIRARMDLLLAVSFHSTSEGAKCLVLIYMVRHIRK